MFTSTYEKRGVIRLDRDIIVDATQAGLSLLSWNCVSCEDFYAHQALSFIQNSAKTKAVTGSSMDSITDERGQRRLARLVGADREATLTQMTTLYSCGEQTLNAQHVQTWGGWTTTVAHVSQKQKICDWWAHTHQNWTAEDLKSHGLNESRFLRMHIDGEVRIWHRLHESMTPTCLESTVQAAVLVW